MKTENKVSTSNGSHAVQMATSDFDRESGLYGTRHERITDDEIISHVGFDKIDDYRLNEILHFGRSIFIHFECKLCGAVISSSITRPDDVKVVENLSKHSLWHETDKYAPDRRRKIEVLT